MVSTPMDYVTLHVAQRYVPPSLPAGNGPRGVKTISTQACITQIRHAYSLGNIRQPSPPSCAKFSVPIYIEDATTEVCRPGFGCPAALEHVEPVSPAPTYAWGSAQVQVVEALIRQSTRWPRQKIAYEALTA